MIMAKSNSASMRGDANKTGVGIKIVLAVVAVLCAAALVYTICDASGLLARNTTAMTVGSDKISANELNQYYVAARNSYLNNYGSTLQQYGYDIYSSTFDSTVCLFDTSRTWKEYFLDSAKASAEQISVLCQKAEQEGFATVDDCADEVADYVASMETEANTYGLTLKQYLSKVFGNGTRLADAEHYYAKRALGAKYMEHLLEGFGITSDDVQDYFEENKDDYMMAGYYRYNISYTEDTKASEEAKAQDILNALAADGSNFDETAKSYDTESTWSTYYTETALSSFGDDVVSAWLQDSRKAGDMDVLDDEDNSRLSVVLYVDEHISDDYTVAVRHILIKASDDAGFADAKKKAEDILAEWKAGEATEASFGELAAQYSEDGNAADGGLYTDIYQGQMVANFDAWCFDESRKPGDTGIVLTDYGYHVMYFVENEGLSYLSEIQSKLENDAFSKWYSENSVDFPVTVNKLGTAVM